MSRALDAPQSQSVSNAVNLLRKIGACHPDHHLLTPLGHHLASLPVNVKIGKMLIYGAILGCLEPIVRPTVFFSENSLTDILQLCDDHILVYYYTNTVNN